MVITSCLRITTINQQATTYDPTYDIASTMWTVIEMNVAIVCACLSQIRPVIMMLFPKLMPASYSRDRSAKAPNNNSLAKLSSSPAKSVSSHWMVSGRHDDIALGAMRQTEGSSDEHILPEDRTMHIQKTVRYSVEYSRDEMNLV